MNSGPVLQARSVTDDELKEQTDKRIVDKLPPSARPVGGSVELN